MKLIIDLGVKQWKKSKRHRGVYECPVCKKHFEAFVRNVENKTCTKCKSCATTIHKTTHGLRKTKLYKVFDTMIQRTENKNSEKYSAYGGRGIKIYQEWRNDFKLFYDWAMENGYRDGLSIDRIDVNGGYCPENCRWADNFIQQRNVRVINSKNTSGYKGASFVKQSKKFKSMIGVNRKRIFIGYFKTAEEAGYAYDKYVIENNLEHTTNGLYIKEIV